MPCQRENHVLSQCTYVPKILTVHCYTLCCSSLKACLSFLYPSHLIKMFVVRIAWNLALFSIPTIYIWMWLFHPLLVRTANTPQCLMSRSSLEKSHLHFSQSPWPYPNCSPIFSFCSVLSGHQQIQTSPWSLTAQFWTVMSFMVA